MKERIITGIVLAIVALWAIVGFSLYVFEAVIGIVLLIAAMEWVKSFLSVKSIVGQIAYLVVIAFISWACWQYPQVQIHVLAASVLWWLIACILIRFYSIGIITKISKVVKAIMGVCVIVPAWVAVIILKDGHSLFLLFVILAVTLADSGAYFVGKFFGKHKLAPNISPKKTWEGLAGGVFFSAIGSVIFALVLHLDTPMQYAILIVLGIFVVFFALLGDLFESMIKREVGIKDSGNILPGHGGILDRLDSLFVALPLFVFFASIVGVL